MFKRLATMAPRSLGAGSVLTPRLSPALSNLQTQQTPAFPRTQPTQRRGYHEKDTNPRNVGSLSKEAEAVGTGLVGAPACGDVMKLQIQVDPESNKIDEVKFKTFGCGSAIASSSYLTELVRGMTLEEAGRIRNTEIAKELCLPPVKLHCSMLAEDAIKSAIDNYYKKNPTAASTDLAGTGGAVPDVKVEVEKGGGSPSL